MQAHTTWLSSDEKSRIADEAFRVPGEPGMRFAGCTHAAPAGRVHGSVDEDAGVVRLPRRELVECSTVPLPALVRVMAGATPADDIVLGPGPPVRFSPSSCVRQDARLTRPGCATPARCRTYATAPP